MKDSVWDPVENRKAARKFRRSQRKLTKKYPELGLSCDSDVSELSSDHESDYSF